MHAVINHTGRQLGYYLESWFEIIKRNPTNHNTKVKDKEFTLALNWENPQQGIEVINTEQLSPIIMAYTDKPITRASFCNISKQYSRLKADELLIAPQNTTKSKDEWRHCWNIIAKHQHKFPGSLEYLQFYLLGNLQKQLSTAQTKQCILCKGSDETLNHLVWNNAGLRKQSGAYFNNNKPTTNIPSHNPQQQPLTVPFSQQHTSQP
ncbi:unnamed protein product [Ambrosiozyma monospora]|uniref:Unnamed protein product n=1 Tax=Ambrosiozyma monospora TaxID=43982 RepID=A0A9W6Z5Q4_AMBMO|nr:unnamed protein product [Ambrosiozyma monospora]